MNHWQVRGTLRHRQASGTGRRGMVLILVLVVVAALSLAAITFAQWMFTERESASVSGRQATARALAESGAEAVRQILSTDAESAAEAGGWYDNADLFRGVVVVDSDLSRDRGRFTVLAPAMDQGQPSGMRYGLEDESAKLNLNTLVMIEKTNPEAAKALLMSLPGMTEDTAEAILDWLDEDDEPRASGAEVDYYSSLDPPYAPKNGLLDSLDELLMVRGVTPELLFGVDANRNGYADDTEPDASTLGEVDSSQGLPDCGWSAYLTLYSLEANVRSDGQARINVNQEDLEALYKQLQEVLEPDQAKYIVAYRQQADDGKEKGSADGSAKEVDHQHAEEGDQQKETETPPSSKDGSAGDPGSNGKAAGSEQTQSVSINSGELDLSQAGQKRIASLLDLIDAKVQVKFKGQKTAAAVDCPFKSANMSSYLPKLMDLLTTEEGKVIPGRININQAPKALLAAIPGMPEEAVDTIVSSRQPETSDSDVDFTQPTWPLIKGILTLDQMKKLLPFVTARGSVYRAQVAGFFDHDGPTARIEAVFDSTQRPARIVSWRELTPLGRGYPLEMLGAEAGAR